MHLSSSASRTILGIEPGSRFAGYGIVRFREEKIIYVDHGTISVPPHLSFSAKLAYLDAKLRELFLEHSPDHTVVEKIFLGKNPDSAFKLGHVRGICLMRASLEHSQVYEYDARRVKKIVAGSGAATKEDVRAVIHRLFDLTSEAHLDATDALSLAVCHFREWGRLVIEARAKELIRDRDY